MPTQNHTAKNQPDITIRPAIAADQAVITGTIRAAGINPTDLNWRRFLVAEDYGQIVGMGQIKPHGDGSRELASIAVSPERQNQGIASLLIERLLSRESRPVYLMCRQKLEGFYERFGFYRVDRAQMPPYFRRMTPLINIFTPIISVIGRERINIIVMKRESSS